MHGDLYLIVDDDNDGLWMDSTDGNNAGPNNYNSPSRCARAMYKTLYSLVYCLHGIVNTMQYI